MKYAITPILVLVFIQKNFAVIKGDRLPPLTSLGLNNSDFDPDVSGKYHMDAFVALKEKYQQTNGFPPSLLDVKQDMKEILIGYCSDSDESYEHCLKEANRFTSEEYHADLTPGAARSFLSESIMERLENSIISSHANNKESTLNEIYALKQELHDNEYDENEKLIGLMTLSIAAESFSFWHDVIHDENHIFHRRHEDGDRELQTVESFGFRFCLNILFVVQADYDGGAKEYDKQGDQFLTFNGILSIIYAAIVHSLSRFTQACEITTPPPSTFPTVKPSLSPTITASPTKTLTSQPSLRPSAEPSESPSTKPSLSFSPSVSFKPTSSIKTPEPTNKPSAQPSKEPSESPSASPSISFSPTFGEESLNELITCIAVIDEAYETQVTYFDEKWNRFRVFFPDRPFCLLQPSLFTSFADAQDYPYPAGVTDGSGISIPNNFYNDPKQIFKAVRRDNGDESQISDWYELCDLEGLRGEGISRVAFFIDESGSMTRDNVAASLDYFQEQLAIGGVEIVGAIYNDAEDWITPFLTNFGFDGPTITDPEILCKNESVSEKLSRWMRKISGNENKA